MKEMIKKYWWIAVIGLVVVVAVWALNRGGNNETISENSSEAIPTKVIDKIIPGNASGFGPNPLGGASKEAAEKQKNVLDKNKEMYPLASELPYKTVYFTINHYIKPMRLVVYIKRDEDKDMAEQMIEKWLEEKGFNANSHEIEWRIRNQ